MTDKPTGREFRISTETWPTEDVILRADAPDGMTFSGYAAVFNSFSVDIGGFREIIRPGAFASSLRKTPDVRFLINHDGLPLARTPKTLVIYEDQRGLKVEANLDPNDPDVMRLKPKMDRGDVDQMSFAFRTISDSWRTERGEQIRELHEVDIDGGDVSIVTYPAYPATEAALRSLEAWKQEAQRASQAHLEAAHQHRDRMLRLQERQ